MSGCGAGNPDWPDAGERACCYGAAEYGPQGCTCWQPEYDLPQQPTDRYLVGLLAAGVQPNTRALMCGGCAYRPDSPERRGDPRHVADADELERIAATSRFWCHQGIPRVVRWVHPAGVVAPGHPAAYEPLTVGPVPLRADGTPAELCAGWAARRRALTGRHHLDDSGGTRPVEDLYTYRPAEHQPPADRHDYTRRP